MRARSFRRRRTNPIKRTSRFIAVFWITLASCAVVGVGAATTPKSTSAAFPSPNWEETVGSVAISSPTVATIEGTDAVVFGTESGYVYVINAVTGANLPGWPEPVMIAPNKPSAIESSPTVAFLDGPNNPPSIIVGAGSTYIADQQGGVEAFNANGTVRFTYETLATFNEWGNSAPAFAYANSVFSTPAVGDITGSGQQDIVFGSYDHNLYALTPAGKLVPGFPIDTQDTIWSSPALFHVRGPHNRQDIFIGGDASGLDGCYGGFIYDVTYAHHAPHIVWQHCKNQTIWSSPAVGVINSTDRPVVVVGTGFGEKPPYKSDTDSVFAFYARNGAGVPGWPVKTTGPVFGSPAIGLLPGSALPSVVDTAWCLNCVDATSKAGVSMVYAWNGAGQLLWEQTLEGKNDFSSPVLVDLSGSGVNDVLVGSSAGLFPLDGGTGDFLFKTSENSGINTCSMQNAVAVADVPSVGWQAFETCGGPIEVTLTGRVYDYPLHAAPLVIPPWPMWRENAAHDGVATATLP